MPKTTTTKSASSKTPRKPKATTVKKKTAAVHREKLPAIEAEAVTEVKVTSEKPEIAKGRYIFATGRRKTSVANVRLFQGEEESQVNKKAFNKYFAYSYHSDEAVKPLELTGLLKDYFFVAHVNGGGPHSQAQALRHGIATALGSLSEDIRKVLKKNGMLTRDDRKKERKKPGLKRARRSPQWAKR
jgi:small subunit ribosomal protein S9